ncbi:MAG: hypothetical protein JWL84_592 [Rhodospirillales bacterium]|nr:hypothetical protein [Rhodospirillales bacterium]
MTSRIYVDAARIAKATETGTVAETPIIIERGGKRTYANRVRIAGPSEVTYAPERPFGLGARCWIETESDVEIIS